jgi:hypothetical protein
MAKYREGEIIMQSEQLRFWRRWLWGNSLLIYYAMQSGRCFPTFQGNVLRPSSWSKNKSTKPQGYIIRSNIPEDSTLFIWGYVWKLLHKVQVYTSWKKYVHLITYLLVYKILWSLCVEGREARYNCGHQADTLLILKGSDDSILYLLLLDLWTLPIVQFPKHYSVQKLRRWTESTNPVRINRYSVSAFELF